MVLSDLECYLAILDSERWITHSQPERRLSYFALRAVDDDLWARSATTARRLLAQRNAGVSRVRTRSAAVRPLQQREQCLATRSHPRASRSAAYRLL